MEEVSPRVLHRLRKWADEPQFVTPCVWKGKAAAICVAGTQVVMVSGSRLYADKAASIDSFSARQTSEHDWNIAFYYGDPTHVTFGSAETGRGFVEATIEVINGKHQQLADRTMLTNLDSQDRLLERCIFLGGAALPIRVGALYDIVSRTDHIEIWLTPALAADKPVMTHSIDPSLSVDILGPGAVSRGGGFSGGGFGAEAAIEGMAVASVLNSMTTRTSIETIITVADDASEAFFLHQSATPEEVRRHLSPLFVSLRRTQLGERQ